MVLIFISSSIPMNDSDGFQWVPYIEPTLQNLLHIPLYALLSFLWVGGLREKKLSPRVSILLAILVSTGFGCLDEIHQAFVPGRYGGGMDVLLNAVGAVVGGVVRLGGWEAGKL